MSFSESFNHLEYAKIEENEKCEELRDILPMFLDDFIKDFSFMDIYPYINSNGIIFTDDDLKKIASMIEEENRTILIFEILKNKKTNLKAFVDILRRDYLWLHEKVENGRKSYRDNKNIAQYLNVSYELQSRFPKHCDNNVRRIEYFAKIRDCLKRLKRWQYLIVAGELGLGKKWLALDACCDYSVIKAMDFKIFWLDVHNCDSREMDLEKLQRFKIKLGETNLASKIGDYEGISNKILELQQDLKSILKRDEFKDCLLVLSDVQNCRTIDAFSLPCKILVTTRNKKIMEYLPRTQMKIVNIKTGLTHIESLELFESVLEQESNSFPEILYDIIEYSKSHPFLLNIIAQHLKEPKADKWSIWKSNLEHFRVKNDRINTVIRLSLKVLKPDELELFHTLSIFHHTVKIPIPVLASYWDKTEKETENLIKKFDRYSLVTKIYFENTDTMACLIHILYYNYLKNYVKNDQTVLNKNLVESYNIQDVLRNRSDINMSFPDDYYFYYYIGYHLKEAKMTHLFGKLYLDLGFLGQKLRATGLPNTIGDLKYFRREITAGDPYKEKFLDCLHEFLPNIEEMIFKSDDTYLLQYAIMTNGLLHSEAVRQASKFPHRVWFSDSDHFHRRRQIVPLREKPKVIKLMEPNTCLVALERHNILVADLSLNYSTKPTCFTDHDSEILRIELFTENYFLSLDTNGNIRIWSINRERRESVIRKESLRFIVNQIDYSTCLKVRERKSVQLIMKDIQSFFIEKDEYDEIILHTVLSNGAIQFHKWNDSRHRFQTFSRPALETRTLNIKFILRVANIYMVLNKFGKIKFFNVRDGSERPIGFAWPDNLKTPINVHHHCLNERFATIIFVFGKRIFQIRFPLNQNSERNDPLFGTVETLYEINENESITCSVLSDDKRYLIVGTIQGILVLDVTDKAELLRNSISDHIKCVDIYSLDDEIYKYIIISASKEHKQLNIFGLKRNGNQSLTWANSIGTFVNECDLNLRFEPTAWLMGKQLFDVILDDNKTLVAIDSKNRIHHLLDRNWSMILPDNIRNKITVVKTFGKEYFYGCQDGVIHSSNERKFDTTLKDSIIFLKLFGQQFFVASTAHRSVFKRGHYVSHFMKPVIECYLLPNDYLLLIKHNCSISINNASGEFEMREFVINNDQSGGIDFKANTLVVAGRKGIYIYKIDVSNKIEIKEQRCICDNDLEITAIEISSDGDICAVGYISGLIEIYKIEEWQLIQKLDSHRSKIFDMKFSPWISTNLPIVLVSISEQICFWNVTHILNNPLPLFDRGERHSSRFSSKNRISKEKTTSNKSNTGYDVTDSPNACTNVWSNKRGAIDKCELLSCIKFAGNKAEQLYTDEKFTEFVTIDDEGEIYFFKVNELEVDDGNFHKANGNVQI